MPATLPATLHDDPTPLVTRIALLTWATIGLALLFCGAMTRGVTYDEDQYIAAGVMAQELMPYRDFVYLQPPLYPFLLGALFPFAQGWFVLMARFFTFGLATLSALLLWHLVRRLGAGRFLAVILLTACLSSPFLLAPLANARNDALPLALMLAGLTAHLWAEDHQAPICGDIWTERAARLAAALLMGLALEAKLSYLFAPAALLVHALFAPRRRLPPILLGGALSAVPAIFCAIEAPDAFRFGILDYHLAAPQYWYQSQGMGDLLEPWARVRTIAEYGAVGGNLTLLVLVTALALVAIARHRKWKRPGRLLLGLTIGAFFLALAPAPSWAMYFAPVPPLLACCIAHLDRVTSHLAAASSKRILTAVAGLASLPFLALQLAELPLLLNPSRWVGVEIHRNAQAIRDAIPPRDSDREVATLFPMLVVDANPIRPEFASGPFVYRSAAAFPPDRLVRLHALSATTIEAAFDDSPPDAIYAGRYAEAWAAPLDAELAAYAQRHAWPLVRTDAWGGKLWVRP